MNFDLVLMIFSFLFFSGTLRQQASSSMWGDYVQNLLREGIQKPKYDVKTSSNEFVEDNISFMKPCLY